MKRSDKPTPYILVKAYTTSEWDTCDFAIIHVTEEWKTTITGRIKLLQPLNDTKDFFNVSYWGGPEGFYLQTPESAHLLKENEDWCYIITDGDEIESLTVPEDPLDAEQMILVHSNAVYYKAFSKHSSDELCTAEFRASDIINSI